MTSFIIPNDNNVVNYKAKEIIPPHFQCASDKRMSVHYFDRTIKMDAPFLECTLISIKWS